MPLGYLGATRGEISDELGTKLQGELTCHQQHWARPDLPARGAVSHAGEPERPREKTNDGLDSCPGMLSIRIHVQGDVGNLRRPVKPSVTLNLPCINERSIVSNSNTLENTSVTS